MTIRRLYTGNDGHSAVEELLLPPDGQLSALSDVNGVIFRATAPGYHADLHTVPWRQVNVLLSGNVELGLHGGALVSARAGDVLIVEDTAGTGHSAQSWVTIFVSP